MTQTLSTILVLTWFVEAAAVEFNLTECTKKKK